MLLGEFRIRGLVEPRRLPQKIETKERDEHKRGKPDPKRRVIKDGPGQSVEGVGNETLEGSLREPRLGKQQLDRQKLVLGVKVAKADTEPLDFLFERENLLLKPDHRTDLAISLLEIDQRGAGLFKRPAFRLKVAALIGLFRLVDGEPGQLAKGLNLLDEGIEQISGNADRKLQGSISIETLTLFVLYQRIAFADQAADAGVLLFKLGGSQPDIRDLFVLLIGAGSDGRGLNRNRSFALVRCVVFDALPNFQLAPSKALPRCKTTGLFVSLQTP